MPANFSAIPTDEEIFRVHFFEEPLVPTDISAASGENLDLVYALAGFSQRKSEDDFSMLLKFLRDYPQSRWRGALLADLGLVYRRTGYFSKAMKVWQESWDLLKNQRDPKIKVLADRVISELLIMNAWSGRQNKIDSLLKETDQRVMEGPAVERIISMRNALSIMRNQPGISFKCGPYALNRLFALHDSMKPVSETLMNIQSTDRGFSLTELVKLAKAAGMNYRMAFRQPGAEVIANAVVHWKMDHYSALLMQDSGHYRCEDATMGTTYGQQFWVSRDALDSSASGYFLVPEGVLPKGWRDVPESEGSTVFGKGMLPKDNGKHVSQCDIQLPECTSCTTPPMAQSNIHAAVVSLHIFDQPVYYTPPKGPAMMWRADYHQRDSYQPANFNYSNIGPKWTVQYLSYVQDYPSNQAANVDIYLMGGGDRTFTGYNAVTQSYAPELQSNDVLVRVCSACYELRHPDGSKEVYARPDGNTANGRKIFLTQSVDAAGNALTLSYDALLRISALMDAIGQVTTISYASASDYKIARVTDPFGRFASFDYDTQGRLIKITDMIGIVSSFHYAGSDFIDQMTTPYGTTNFIKEDGSDTYASLKVHYPLGEKERVEFRERAPGINYYEAVVPPGPTMEVYNTYLDYRNTFFWDKKAMQDAPGDYTKAKIYRWLHGSVATGDNGFIAPILESVKAPLENRVWYNFQGQLKEPYYHQALANQGMSARHL